MDGKVEVSILQWEKIRKEHGEMSEMIEDLKTKQKEVKLTVIDKVMTGHLQFNRYNGRNEFIGDDKEVESVKYVGFEQVKEVLKEEARDEVKSELGRLMQEVNEYRDQINQIKADNNQDMRNLRRDHNEIVDKLKEQHQANIKKLEDHHMKEINDWKEKYEELEGKKKAEKELTEIEELKKTIKRYEQTVTDLKSKLPWWRR